MLYRPDRGWGMGGQGEASAHQDAAFARLEERIADLERRLPGEKSEQRVVAEKLKPPAAEEKFEPQQPVEKL